MLDSGAIPPAAARTSRRREVTDERDTFREAVSIWRGARPADGTAAERYLRNRGIRIPIPPTIRFAQLPYGRRGDVLPCLVAVVASPGGKVAGVQRTFLKPDGSGKADVPSPKLSLGRIREGAIRLGPAAPEMIVCEGAEDALTAVQELQAPAWAAAGASLLPSIVFPPVVRSVVIAADNDAGGDREARKAAEAFAERGLTVRIMRPDPQFKDLNDQLLGKTR
jgi:DNA primase